MEVIFSAHLPEITYHSDWSLGLENETVVNWAITKCRSCSVQIT